jgi:6-phosphogluconolactonase
MTALAGAAPGGGAATAGSIAGFDSAELPIPNTGEPALIVLPSPSAVAREAADRIAAALTTAIEERGRADLCTTGGSTVIPIYRLLASSPRLETIPWSRVNVWWGDDRFVPRGHPESNVTPLDCVLTGPGGAPLPGANVHPFPVGAAMAAGRDTAWCAARYADLMAAELHVGPGNWPVFDLVIVGIGNDGHVLSCFPGSALLDSLAWTMAIPAPRHVGPHIPRMTVNPRLLEASPVLAVTWGGAKAAALGSIFGPVRDDRRWPAQRLRRPGATWLVDEAAARSVDRPEA